MNKLCLFAFLLMVFAAQARADGNSPMPAQALATALPPEKWSQLEKSVDRALDWLAGQQRADGSFPTLSAGQPGVTSLCVMAYLSRGHQPGFGPYGQQLNRAIDYVLSCQQEDGLICHDVPEPVFKDKSPSHTATYNHAISGLMLGEVYGHIAGPRAKKARAAIVKALNYSRALQTRDKPFDTDAGGVRYLPIKPGESDADLSVTAWTLMFYRSAKNAEFNVPQQYADQAVTYVRRCWDPSQHMFSYAWRPVAWYGTDRAMTGAGVLSLSLAGQHNSALARAAGDWLVEHPFTNPKGRVGRYDRVFYGAYYCSQAAAQLGGAYWEQIFPPLVQMLLNAQAGDGSFPPEAQVNDGRFGNAYTTALAVLAMTPAYQLLPVYQR